MALAKFLGHFFNPHFFAKAVYNEKGRPPKRAPLFIKQSSGH
jgi:hypothetical protein